MHPAADEKDKFVMRNGGSRSVQRYSMTTWARTACTSVRGESTPATDATRFLEIWNLVFMQFDQDASGALVAAAAPASTPAWVSSVSPRCSRGSRRATTATCSSRSCRPRRGARRALRRRPGSDVSLRVINSKTNG